MSLLAAKTFPIIEPVRPAFAKVRQDHLSGSRALLSLRYCDPVDDSDVVRSLGELQSSEFSSVIKKVDPSNFVPTYGGMCRTLAQL